MSDGNIESVSLGVCVNVFKLQISFHNGNIHVNKPEQKKNENVKRLAHTCEHALDV